MKPSFRIRYTHQGTYHNASESDLLASHAVAAYAFVLNTTEHAGQWRTGPQFAEAIAEACSTDEPVSAMICNHLKRI